MLFCFRFGDVFCDVSWLFVAIFSVSTNVFRSNDVCYVFHEFVDVMRFLMSCVFMCVCFKCSICVAMCVVWFSIFGFCEVLGVCMCGDCLVVFHY